MSVEEKTNDKEAKKTGVFFNNKVSLFRKFFSKFKKGYKRRVLLVAGAVLVLVILVIVVLALVFLLNKNEAVKTKTPETSTLPQTAENIRDDAVSKALSEDNPKSAIEIYQKSIDSYNNNEKKSMAYIQRAAELYSYYGDKYKDQILADAYKAEEIYPSPQSATFIYQMETKFGNIAVAEKYSAIIDERTKINPEVGS